MIRAKLDDDVDDCASILYLSTRSSFLAVLNPFCINSFVDGPSTGTIIIVRTVRWFVRITRSVIGTIFALS